MCPENKIAIRNNTTWVQPKTRNYTLKSNLSIIQQRVMIYVKHIGIHVVYKLGTSYFILIIVLFSYHMLIQEFV